MKRIKLTPSMETEMQFLLDEIFNAIYRGRSKREDTIVLRILSDEDNDSLSAANEICEGLGIEKRENRSVIKQVLDKWYI